MNPMVSKGVVAFNCETIVNGVTTTNLQTMLGIHAPQPPDAAVAAARRGTRIEATAKPTVDEVRRIMRAELRRRS